MVRPANIIRELYRLAHPYEGLALCEVMTWQANPNVVFPREDFELDPVTYYIRHRPVATTEADDDA